MRQAKQEFRSMHTPFFPLSRYEEIVNRDQIMLLEYGYLPPPDYEVSRYMALSDRAHKRREERMEAQKQGKIYVG